MSAAIRWRIHLTSTWGCTSTRGFTGTRAEAEAKAAAYLGGVASWNGNKWPHQPNVEDVYNSWRVEQMPE